MDLGDRLQRWWDRVRGYEPPAARTVDPPPGNAAKPAAARQISSLAGADAGETLKLSVDGKPAQGTAPRRGEAGFDPYANSAGYRKPRGWDNVPRK
jgi:hypothetical protein